MDEACSLLRYFVHPCFAVNCISRLPAAPVVQDVHQEDSYQLIKKFLYGVDSKYSSP